MAKDADGHERLVVRDSDSRSRFELLDGDSVIGYADYRITGDGAAVMPHTAIDPARRGEGLGDVLVGAATRELRDRGLDIRPTCWFVDDYLRRHPETA